ncbi:MAG: hypothetical protein LLG04_13430 [Parachlamydia sp.]|nr:hypothetical protein [Parachlamydia sp.]
MDEMGALYLDYFQYHLEEAQAIGLQYATDICWAAKAINMCYIYKLWSRALHADDWSDIWLEVCWGRTNIEAFHAMFGEFVRELDVAGILEYMESKKGHEKVDLRQIPKNVPKSHWWWFEDFTKDNT